MTAGEPDVFDDALVAATAAEHDVDDDVLAALARRHQEAIESLPGVENLVYEWRKHYDAPVLDRTPGAYYLAVHASVWDEFADALDADDEGIDALVDLHRRTVVDRTDAEPTPRDSRTYVVLDRTVD